VTEKNLNTFVTVDHTGNFRNVDDGRYNRERTIHLRFTRNPGDSDYLVQAWGSAFPQDGGGGYQGRMGRAVARSVNANIDLLRNSWQELVVEHDDRQDGRRTFPFVDEWDLSGPAHRHRLDEIGLKLARTGYDTFRAIFCNGDAGLDEIADHLQRALRCQENVITMESDDLFVPWNVLYTPSDESGTPWDHPTWSMAGFWGYNHLIEHSFSRVPGFDGRIITRTGRITIGLNVDERVDHEYPQTPYIKPLVDFLVDRADVIVRRRKDELAEALQDPNFADHVIYFGCHSRSGGGQAYLKLSDGEKIYSAQMMGWLAHRQLSTRPVVFVGACQGGRLASPDPTFAQHLLNHGARCLLGPQIDLPRAFAREYAKRFFVAFLEPHTRLGDIVRSLTRVFADDYRNPLALAFSLYRGLDVHLHPGGD
jgi:hypothetical protein